MATILDFDVVNYDAQGTVSYSALTSARILGCSKIVLIGQDLAYSNNQCYSKDSIFADVIFDMDPETNTPKFKIKNEENYIKSDSSTDQNKSHEMFKSLTTAKLYVNQESLFYVKGITGEMLPTLAMYAVFVEFFNSFAYNNPQLELINASMVGAQIDGFKNMPLEQALKGTSKIEKIQDLGEFEYDKNEILRKITLDKNRLLEIKKDLDIANGYMFRYEREFNRGKTATKESIKYLKLLLSVYEKLDVENNKNILYTALSYAERVEVSSMLRETEDFTTEAMENLYKLLNNYFKSVEERLLEAIKGFEQQEKLLNESLNLTSIKH